MIREMRLLSLWQPWASLIAYRLKQYETRSWHTNYRGLLAIHAAKRPIDGEGLRVIDQAFQLSGCRHENICLLENYPLGAIVAVSELTDCLKMDGWSIAIHEQSPLELAVGDWRPERFAWKLANVLAVPKPMPLKGAQGLRRLDAEAVRTIEQQLGIGGAA